MTDIYDIIVIGGGAAGFTAGMYAARDRQRALLIEKFSAGGQVLNCEHIENFPGFPEGVAGYSFGPMLQQQAMNMGLEMKLAEVQSLQLDGGVKVLQTDDGELRARAVIIATGSSFTKLNIPGEEEFLGNGVSHCASCDGAFFMDQPVAVVGGGDAALDEGLHLTQYASQVTIIHRREELRACQLLQERAQSTDKIAFRWNTIVRAIEGEGTVQRVQLEDVNTGERSYMDVAGVFLFVGLTPNTQFLNGLVPLNDRGQILTDVWMRTPVPGVLAAGDVRHASARQLVTSAGDGATAALAAIHYLRTGEWGS
ncbi:MAG TPA: thioredoxin-disulfide reductase [Methylomirabilota bacterium]|jgi:thioredoxin reductase (NADPH)|nr:thioredoxin-disulfide reductase [Methylomirabilota bacterium]